MIDPEMMEKLSETDLDKVAGGTVESYHGVCKTCKAITLWVQNFWHNGYICSQCQQDNPGTVYDLQ